MAINDAGQVVGIAATPYPNTYYPTIEQTNVFLFDGGVLHDPQLNTCDSLTINNHGTIFYSAPGTSGCYTSRLARSVGGEITYIDIPGTYLSLRDSNNREQVLGNYSATAEQRYVNFLFENGVARELPDPFGYGSQWNAINNDGIVVGEVGIATKQRQAAILDASGYHNIHPFSQYGSSDAAGINNVGLVAGTFFSAPYSGLPSHAFTYDTRTGTTRDLGPGSASAINDRGQILGFTDEGTGSPRPALYDGQQFQLLQALIPADSPWQILSATRINNVGQILATGKNTNTGESHALVLSPRLYDVPADSPYRTAIVALTNRGIIQGYADGRFGPADLVLRAQSAALIARAAGWDTEDWSDEGFPDRGPVDDDLWRNVRTLAHYRVAQGYADGTYDPTGPVLHQQAILFITRALVEKGFWKLADDSAPYPNLPNGTAREQADRRAIATYVREAGALPDRPLGPPWADWNTPATRGWYAQVLYQALATLPSTQPVP